MLTRRGLILRAGAALTASGTALGLSGGPADADEDDAASTLKVGVLEFGTAGWEVETIRRLGLGSVAGLSVEPVRLASNEAARLAFLDESVDTVVSHLFWAARLKAEGRDIAFVPFSTNTGALMVPADSQIQGVEDLLAARIGVAGGPSDKGWLLLRAFARRTAGLDLGSAAKPVFGSPLVLSDKFETGGLDAALLYWTLCVRLEARGFRRMFDLDAMARSLGASGPISLLGYVFDRGRLGDRAPLIAAFAAASRAAKARLAADTEAWAVVRPLIQAEDEPIFETLRSRFIDGIPQRALDAEEADAARLYGVLAGLGGEKFVGSSKRLPAGLYALAAE